MLVPSYSPDHALAKYSVRPVVKVVCYTSEWLERGMSRYRRLSFQKGSSMLSSTGGVHRE
jgi:hypothetical protein